MKNKIDDKDIKELKLLVELFDIAEECDCVDEDIYNGNKDISRYIGCSSDDLVGQIIRIIKLIE